MSDTSEQEASSTKKKKSVIFSVLWRVAVLTVGINLLTSIFATTAISPFSLDSLGARTLALGFKAADYVTKQGKTSKPDYRKLSKKYKLPRRQIERFFEVRSGNNSELFTDYGAMGICAVSPLKLLKLELSDPFDSRQAASSCMEWLSNMKGKTFRERLVRFSMSIDGSNKQGAEFFANEVLVSLAKRK